MYIDTRQFEKAIQELAANCMKDDAGLITTMGRYAVRSVAYNTPYKTGHLRAGWRAAWNGLGMSGQPSRRPDGLSKKLDYRVDGEFVDGRKASNPFVSFENKTVAIRRGKEYDYGRRNNFHGKNKGWMDRGLQEASEKIRKRAEQEYRKNIRKANRG